MDNIPPTEPDYTLDLETGVSPTIAELPSPISSSGTKLTNTLISKFRELLSNEAENSTLSSAVNKGEVSPQNLKLVVVNKMEGEEGVDKKLGKKKNKKGSAKKPPRPPRGLSLDAADQKLIKEIAEIAMLKRARVERMKALKRMRASKTSSSSSGNLLAMLFTVLFCLVILFQGMSSGSSAVGFEGSPKSAQGKEGGFISVTNHWNPYTTNTNIPASGSPSLVEQVGGLTSEHNKVGRAAR